MADSAPVCGLLIVDDHGIVREGLMAMLQQEPGMQVLGAATSGEEGILAAHRLQPEIVIMDLILPDMSGMEATRRILADLPQTRVIMLSMRSTVEHVYGALRAGAMGYVVKDAPAGELMQAVHAVKAGRQYLSPQVTPAMADGAAYYTLPKSPLERLSARERDVLYRIVAGASSSTIGRVLSLSPKTVDTYRGRLMAKLGVCDRSALIRFAIENGFTGESSQSAAG